MNIATPGRNHAAGGGACIAAALTAAAVCTLTACGPGVATPMPEPPTFNFARIGPPETEPVTQPASTPDGGRHIYGLSGAAPPGSLVRVTNLDRVDPTVVSSVKPDGGFDLNIVVNPGDELRFAWSSGPEQGAPQDARFIQDSSSFHFEPAARFGCLQFTPGLALDFAGGTPQSLRLQNDCGFAVSLATPRTRLGLDDFVLQTALPLVIPAGGATELSISFARAQAGSREDTLFFDVTANADVIRYAVTLGAPAAP